MTTSPVTFDEAVTQTLAEFDSLHAESPPVLYHYTSASGLLGILQSRSLWLTDLRFTNDFSEMQHAQDMLESEFLARLNDKNLVGFARALLEGVHRRAFGIASGEVAYSASFCEEKNLLSQWRGYRGTEGGFAMGFDMFHMPRYMKPRCKLLRVEYNEAKQRRLINDTISAIIASLPADADQSHLEQATEALLHLFLHFCVCFKHPDFHEEREWRLVVFQQDCPQSQYQFRAQGGNIVPYLAVSFGESVALSTSDAYCLPFPIREVVIGPTLDSTMNEMSISKLLRSMSWEQLPIVESSGTPLRWI